MSWAFGVIVFVWRFSGPGYVHQWVALSQRRRGYIKKESGVPTGRSHRSYHSKRTGNDARIQTGELLAVAQCTAQEDATSPGLMCVVGVACLGRLIRRDVHGLRVRAGLPRQCAHTCPSGICLSSMLNVA